MPKIQIVTDPKTIENTAAGCISPPPLAYDRAMKQVPRER